MPVQTTHLLVVVRKPADRPAVAAWCNHCCMILNPNKIMSFVVGRSRTVNPPRGDLVLSGVSICASHNLDILS